MVPGFAPAALCAALRCEALALHAAGRTRPASGQGAGPAFTDASARGDWLLWLHPGDPACGPAAAAAASLLLGLRDELAASVLSLSPNRTELQLAVYPGLGEGGYSRHRDAFPHDGADGCASAQRRVTAVLYAGGAGWDPAAQGGACRVYPPAGGRAGADDVWGEGGEGCGGAAAQPQPPVDVPPVDGTLLLFLSGAVEHEVMPATCARVALSCWMG